jgi:predicted lipoprotein
MMINVLSARLPGRCIILNHHNAPAERMRNTVMPVAGQASHLANPMMKPDKMARTTLAMGVLRVANSVHPKHEVTAALQEAVKDGSAVHAGKAGKKLEQASERIRDAATGDKDK